MDRAEATQADVDLLASLRVSAEHSRAGYDRDLFPHWDDVDGDGCDTRCEVLAAQRRPDGTWLSLWDGYRTDDPTELDIDHVVALAEAWDSGAGLWSAEDRNRFADDGTNLVAVTAASNVRKSDRDAAEWFPSDPGANCFWAATVVRVKAAWDLTVDPAEHRALANLLGTCTGTGAPTSAPTTTAQPTTTQPSPAPPPAAAPAADGCTPGYSPCIPPGDDVDCAGGSGNGPRYVRGPVQVDHRHGDPYDLDRDGDGTACEA